MAAILREAFYILTLTLLSLLLPLSFLLLARLSATQYVIALTPSPTPQASLLVSFFLQTNPSVLHAILSVVSMATLLHGLLGGTSLSSQSARDSTSILILKPRLRVAWILLCTLQICVGLGVEGVVASGVLPVDYNEDNGMLTSLCRIVFFIGLHESMLLWFRIVVKPVADDTILGFFKEERLVEKVAIGLSFGYLWWWRLRGEVGVLVHLVQFKKQLSKGVAVADIVSWWLYYLTVIIGMVRIVNGIIWAGKVLLCRKPEDQDPCVSHVDNDNV
ncbi:hypothetical protein Sjap_007281 [Stephania japonica]|uniref:Transmembrane protein n=1 Tax=Stephania japonica TaxID=461633 RepID=A0AAP0PA99_9MAGN